MSKGKIFYGWFVVAGAFLIAMAIMGMHYNLIGLYFPHVAKTYGFSNSQLGLVFITSAGVTMTLTSLSISKIYSKIALRFGMALAGILAGCAYIGYSFATQMWQFMLCTALIGYCVSTGTVSAFSMLANRWFMKKRGTAISIIASGTGLAGFFFSTYLSGVIESKGYQTAFLHEGFIIIGLTIIGALLIRSAPAELGLDPLGANEISQETKEAVSDNENSTKLRNIDLREAVTKLPFYTMAITLFLMNGIIVTFVSQYVSYFRTLNFTPESIAQIVTGLGISLTLSKVAYGYLNDKLGLYLSNIILFSAWVIAIVSLIMVETSSIFIIAFTICSGTLTVITSVGAPLWVATMFGDKHYPSLIGTITSIGNVGSMSGPIIVGHFIDLYGYKTVFTSSLIIILILCAVISLGLVLARKNRILAN